MRGVYWQLESGEAPAAEIRRDERTAGQKDRADREHDQAGRNSQNLPHLSPRRIIASPHPGSSKETISRITKLKVFSIGLLRWPCGPLQAPLRWKQLSDRATAFKGYRDVAKEWLKNTELKFFSETDWSRNAPRRLVSSAGKLA